MRCTSAYAHDIRAYEVHAYDIYPCEAHIYEMHSYEVYAHEVYAHEMRALETHAGTVLGKPFQVSHLTKGSAVIDLSRSESKLTLK